MTFRSDRPFHPHRLNTALENMQGLLRSKGFCWIASRDDIAAIWSQAGPNLTIEPAQFWHSTEIAPGQEIVFIGVRLDRPAYNISWNPRYSPTTNSPGGRAVA